MVTFWLFGLGILFSSEHPIKDDDKPKGEEASCIQTKMFLIEFMVPSSKKKFMIDIRRGKVELAKLNENDLEENFYGNFK